MRFGNFGSVTTDRLKALSDGVFAIVMTLLILELKVPVNGDLLHGLLEMGGEFQSYVLSFLTLGIFWIAQVTQLKWIETADRHLNWLVLAFLMFASLIPFSTKLLNGYLLIDPKTAMLIYYVNLGLLGLFLYLQWGYAWKNGFVNKLEPDAQAINHAIYTDIRTSQLFYLFGTIVGFVYPNVGIGVLLLVQLNYAVSLVIAGRDK